MKSLNVAVLSLLLFAGAAANGRPTAAWADVEEHAAQLGLTRPAAPVKTETGKDSVTAKADVLPSFRGGPERLAEYLRVNLRYPKEEVAAGTEGRVVVRMIISKTGEVREPEIVQSLSPACDAEVIRIVRAMPRWKPGKSGGQPVNVYFTLPVTFRLPK